MAGAPFPSPSTVVGESIPPRAVNEEYFHSVCPRERVKVLSVEEISEGTNTSFASVVMDRYVRALRDDTEDGCVELRGQDHPFDWRSVIHSCKYSQSGKLEHRLIEYSGRRVSSPFGPLYPPRQ